MEIRIHNIDKHVLPDLLCKACVYWECPEKFGGAHTEEQASVKSKWYETTATQFNPCGKLLYVDDKPVGYCQYAPPQYIPGISRYGELATSVDMNGVFITCLTVCEEYQRKGLGLRLLKDVIEDLKIRGYKSVETISREDSANNCSGPTQFYLPQGFKTVAREIFPNGASLTLVRLDIEK